MSQALLQREQPIARHPEFVHLDVCSTSELATVLDAVDADMADCGFPDRDSFGVRLALEEALVNAIKHGHLYDPAKVVWVRYRVTPAEVLVEVEDEGPGFNPDRVADPLADENLDRSSGRGLLLIRHYLTWVKYEAPGNRVTLCKRRSSQ